MTDAEQPENRYPGEPDPEQVRWNYGVLVLDVTGFAIGMAFLDFSAVLPLLMKNLGADGALIGQFATVRSLCFNLVQVFVAYATHGILRQKPILAWIATLLRLPLLLLPWFIFHAADSPDAQRAALWATVLILSFWALGDGLGYVPWMEIVARAFSHRTRGRFFATTQLLSGIISIAVAALFVQNVLGSKSFPYPLNYALLAGQCALFMHISLIGIYLIKEPPIPAYALNPKPRPPLAAYFRQLPVLMRTNPIFLRLSIIQLLLGFGSAAQPFYVLYATQFFGLDDRWGGRYQVFLAVGIVALMPVWAWLGEKRGSSTAVRGVALACLLTPICAFTVGSVSPWAYGIVFLLMGGSLGWGMWIVLNQFLLAHVSEDERPIFVALLNLIFVPSAFYPTLGGLLVANKQLLTLAGIPILFILASTVIFIGCVLAFRLPEPNTAESR
jgi:MFS family permease